MTELKIVLEYFTEISDSLIGKINCRQKGNKNYIKYYSYFEFCSVFFVFLGNKHLKMYF